jgi:hypothetical protein
LATARTACCEGNETREWEALCGGTTFSAEDVSTHWSEPYQLLSWWKNNVMRRSRFRSLLEDAQYRGNQTRRANRCVTSICVHHSLTNPLLQGILVQCRYLSVYGDSREHMSIFLLFLVIILLPIILPL